MGEAKHIAVTAPARGPTQAPQRLVRRATSAARKDALDQAYAEAASDDAFQAEMDEIDRAFDGTVKDGLDE